jgi:FkbM family methyltransferase
MMKQVLHKVVKSFGYELTKAAKNLEKPELHDYPCIDLLDLLMQDYMQHQPDVFCIQIGAHDGVSADPVGRLIRKYHWRGILIEPQPISFKQLVENYKGEDQLTFEQLVIGAQDGTATFYTVREDIPGLPFWLPQSGGLDKEHLRGSLYFWKHVRKIENLPDDLDSMIEEIPIPQMTINTLLSKHNVERLDLLAMATPGYDFEIIKMFPFEQIKPPIICFEYNCIKDREACLTYLSNLGYSVGRFGSRAVAALNAPIWRWSLGEY